ncbi:hypothetical protein CBR_g21999 [Chara braunii]|uniref:Peptidase M1 membrane alanine aminopeptidase domain-containing protein n=1 Tax=Chara braunii TaxID=69332 RepID=A0A388L1T0_CHABU|nr:hypothetical protein CBR_g21999 [Chara braunii]|eukprot:GBG76251.1 hypothetical protein CBR_g21999 [Chara braunii]
MENNGVACFRGGGGFEDEDETSTCKGACLLRMLRYHVGAKKFKQCAHNFVKTNAFSSFWPAFAEMAGGEGAHIKDFMMTWTTQKGYPLISVELLDSHTIRISQSPFATTMGRAGAQRQSLQLWHVPITLCVSSYSSLEQWLLTEQSTTIKLQALMSSPLKQQGQEQSLALSPPTSPSSTSIPLSSSLPPYRERGSFRIGTAPPWACRQHPPSQVRPIHHCQKRAEQLMEGDEQRSSSFCSSLSSSGYSSWTGSVLERAWRCGCSGFLRAPADMADDVGANSSSRGRMMIKSRTAGNIHNSLLRNRAHTTCRERSKDGSAKKMHNKQSSHKPLQSLERMAATERAAFEERDRAGLRDSETGERESSQRRKHHIPAMEPPTSAEVRERWRETGEDCKPAEKRKSDEPSARSNNERDEVDGDHGHWARDDGCQTEMMGEGEREVDMTESARQRSSREQSNLTLYCRSVADEPLSDSHVEKTDSEEANAGREGCGNGLMKAAEMSSVVPEHGMEKTGIPTKRDGDTGCKTVKTEHRCTERALAGEKAETRVLTTEEQRGLGCGDKEKMKRKTEGDGETLPGRRKSCESESPEDLPRAKHSTHLEERATGIKEQKAETPERRTNKMMDSEVERGDRSHQDGRIAELRVRGMRKGQSEDGKTAEHELRNCTKGYEMANATVSANSLVNDPIASASLRTDEQNFKKDEREKDGKGKEKAEDEEEEEEQKRKMNKDRKETGKGQRNICTCAHCSNSYTPMASNFDVLCQRRQTSQEADLIQQRYRYYPQAHISCDCWIKVNVRQVGFYRVCYDDELMVHLVNALKAGQLAPSDKFDMLQAFWNHCSGAAIHCPGFQ